MNNTQTWDGKTVEECIAILKSDKFQVNVTGSKGNVYPVSYTKGDRKPWRCTCIGYHYRRRHGSSSCKHVDAIKDLRKTAMGK